MLLLVSCGAACSHALFVMRVLAGVPHGQGSVAFDDGSKYEGDWQDGLFHGDGVMRFLFFHQALPWITLIAAGVHQQQPRQIHRQLV
jgi:hypothetical protein